MHVIDVDRPALCLQHVFQLVVRHSNDITPCAIILQPSESDGRKCRGTLWTRYASVQQLRTQGEWMNECVGMLPNNQATEGVSWD